MTDRELMQQALEALDSDNPDIQLRAAIALRQALETEPFEYWSVAGGWVKLDEMREHFEIAGCGTIYKSGGEGRVPLYTAPKQWVGLTDQEINSVRHNRDWTAPWTDETFARAIEAKLKEKNT